MIGLYYKAITTNLISPVCKEEALEMLLGVKARYAAHHGVLIADETLATAMTLSVAWLPDRRLPGKALDLLDEACARARIGRSAGRRTGWRGWSSPRSR